MGKTKIRPRNIIGKSFIVIGWILLIIASIIIGYDYYEANTAYNFANDTISEIKDTIDKEINNLEEFEHLGKIYIGILEIPSLNLSLPVLRNCTDENLRLAPCRFFGDIYTEEPVVIAAHNYPKFFGNLKLLKEGDTVIFRKLDGQILQYRVVGSEMIDGTDVEGMTETTNDLTLFTCNYRKDKRITVRCDKEWKSN